MASRAQRPSAASRGYDGKWRKESAAYLKANPWCVLCRERGIQTQATVVDHKEPHKRDWKKFWDRKNWQPCCKPCHDGPKQSEERTGRVRGCDANGTPLDPGHHWR